MRLTAQSRSAVSSTMTPALPPSSSTTFFLPARSFIRQPTDGEPVNDSSLKRSSATIRSPSSRVIGRIDDRALRHAGRLDDLGHRQHRQRVLGRRLEHDRVARRDGRRDLVGGQVEREVERADPGDRTDREAPGDARPALATRASGRAGSISPTIRSASSAPEPEGQVARSTSMSASRMGLPDSSAMIRPISSRRSLMPR